jgi:Flp pilus assembly protein TadD
MRQVFVEVIPVRLPAIGPLVMLALGAVGCATAMGDGRAALREGNYSEAATRFEQALADNPDRTDALVGLGIAKYKAGDLDGATGPLSRVVAREARSATARLYLGLVHLRKGEIGAVDEHLKTYIAERPGTRVAAQADRVLRVLRGSDPVSEEMRTFMAASLEDEAEMEREVAEARRYARDAEWRARDPFWYDRYYHRPYIWLRRR